MAELSFNEAANIIYAQADKIDTEVMDLFGRIELESRSLTDIAFSDTDKYRVITSLEYLFARLRILVEFELTKIKKVLSDRNTPAALKPFFQSRSVYLAEISAKITLYREDVKVLERAQYAVSNGFIDDK